MNAISYQNNCSNINWDEVPVLLQQVGMSYTTPQIHKATFRASYAVTFVFDGQQLIGFGRTLSDGIRQSAIYDVAVNPHYQGQGIGHQIVKQLIAATPTCNFILYASPGKEGFYKKLGFRIMKTGMAIFSNPQAMADRGFID